MSKSNLRNYLVIAIIGVVIIWILIPVVTIYINSNDLISSGTIGDTFGSVNALFSALAFAFLIYTSMLQREELELQRKELELTREELKKSAEAQKELTELTRDQLNLQSTIRLSQIKPEIAFEGTNWDSTPDFTPDGQQSWIYSIRIKAKRNRFKIMDVKILENTYNFRWVWEDILKENFIEEKQTTSIYLYREEGEQFKPKGLKLDIFYCDEDGNNYQVVYSNKHGKSSLKDA